jgi:hypothetical protein
LSATTGASGTTTDNVQNAYIRTNGAAYFARNLGLGVTEGLGAPTAGTPLGFQLRMSQDSAAKPSTTTWTVSSDERLKEDIELADVDVCYDNVKRIPLKYYKWKDEVYSEEEVADRHKLGWIAQDVEAVFPKAIKKIDMHGIEDCLSLNADQLYASMYGALQKVISLVETQAQQNALLQQQNYDLHARVMVLEQGAQQGVAPLAQDAPLEPQPVPEPESDPAPSPETQDPVEDPAAIVEVIPEAEEATPEPEAEEATPEPEAAI